MKAIDKGFNGFSEILGIFTKEEMIETLCPKELGINLDWPDDCLINYINDCEFSEIPNYEICRKCWDREVPEETK